MVNIFTGCQGPIESGERSLPLPRPGHLLNCDRLISWAPGFNLISSFGQLCPHCFLQQINILRLLTNSTFFRNNWDWKTEQTTTLKSSTVPLIRFLPSGLRIWSFLRWLLDVLLCSCSSGLLLWCGSDPLKVCWSSGSMNSGRGWTASEHTGLSTCECFTYNSVCRILQVD